MEADAGKLAVVLHTHPCSATVMLQAMQVVQHRNLFALIGTLLATTTYLLLHSCHL
jgi:hypothetical protein